jgi:hypothetical protein
MEETEAFIRIPIGDWITALMRSEADIQTEEDLIDLLQKWGTAEIARSAIASRHLKKSPETILPPDKLLLEQGGRTAVSEIVRRRTLSLRIGKREIKIPEFVGSNEGWGGGNQEGDEKVEGYIPSLGKEAVQRVTDYLLKRVPGHIRKRMSILAANEIPLGPIVEDLKREIDQIVDELKA